LCKIFLMQKTTKIIGIINIVVLYCFAIIMTNINLYNPSLQSLEYLKSDNSFSSISIKLFQHTSESENTINLPDTFPVSSTNNTFTKYLAINKLAQKNIQLFLYQYTSFSFNFKINYRKSDKIFPFHCFW